MTALPARLRTLAALGIGNVARVAWYRARLRLRIHPAQHLTPRPINGRLFHDNHVPPVDATPGTDWREHGLLFGRHRVDARVPPAWRRDSITGRGVADGEAQWWRLPDFAGDDIKAVWEPSRFNWVIAFAQRARNGDAAELARLEHWAADWIRENPAYRGPNWKCAQEASIRVLHLALAAVLLDQDDSPTPGMADLVSAHLARIVTTIGYARAQDNNHATSEAAALYIGGSWLRLMGDARADRFVALGRRHLERAVGRLIAADGSFSQHSVTYHRLMLDTLSVTELWRRRRGDLPFSTLFRSRADAAADWLRHMVDPVTGDAPNIGANDGADLLQLGFPYRDFRPSVQLATVLFAERRAYRSGAWDDALRWLGVEVPAAIADEADSRLFDDGGYAVVRAGPAKLTMRFPRFRFRPGHADPLHVDLAVRGDNVLRDAGSFSYNTDAETMQHFTGIGSHNTVQFDGEEPMPRLGRFLFGDWLTTDERSGVEAGRFQAGYHDRRGHSHHRRIELGAGQLRVVDRVGGVRREARLRWRLMPGNWRHAGATIGDGHYTIHVAADRPIIIALTTGYESRHYLERTELPVIEAVVHDDATITTTIEWRT